MQWYKTYKNFEELCHSLGLNKKGYNEYTLPGFIYSDFICQIDIYSEYVEIAKGVRFLDKKFYSKYEYTNLLGFKGVKYCLSRKSFIKEIERIKAEAKEAMIMLKIKRIEKDF